MKKTITNLIKAITVYCLLLTVNCNAQTFPYGINYQAVARDANGNANHNQQVPVQFTIYQHSSTGTMVYQERQVLTTNAMGQFNAVIGNGVIVVRRCCQSGGVDDIIDLGSCITDAVIGNSQVTIAR